MSERCQQPQAHPARCGCEQLTPKGYGEYAGRLVHPDKYAALQAECDSLRAELAAIKAQEPVARAHKGDLTFFVTWTETGKPLRGIIDLYALPTINQQLTVQGDEE